MTGPAIKPRKLPDMMLEAIYEAKKYESIPYHVSARELGLRRDELGRQLKAWRKRNDN